MTHTQICSSLHLRRAETLWPTSLRLPFCPAQTWATCGSSPSFQRPSALGRPTREAREARPGRAGRKRSGDEAAGRAQEPLAHLRGGRPLRGPLVWVPPGARRLDETCCLEEETGEPKGKRGRKVHGLCLTTSGDTPNQTMERRADFNFANFFIGLVQFYPRSALWCPRHSSIICLKRRLRSDSGLLLADGVGIGGRVGDTSEGTRRTDPPGSSCVAQMHEKQTRVAPWQHQRQHEVGTPFLDRPETRSSASG